MEEYRFIVVAEKDGEEYVFSLPDEDGGIHFVFGLDDAHYWKTYIPRWLEGATTETFLVSGYGSNKNGFYVDTYDGRWDKDGFTPGRQWGTVD